MSQSVLVVVVNYRTADMTIDCLRSLATEVETVPGLRVEVVDNASGDGSAPRIAEAIASGGWQAWASLRALEHNGGFAAGNNAAIRPALESADPPEYVLLLNPDTVVRPGAVATLVKFLDARADVGIAGSRLEEHDGTPQGSAFRFHSIGSELENGFRFAPISRLLRRSVVALPCLANACPVDWVSGACMMIRRAVFTSIGLLDEAYFLYFEETDFCHRARRAGWPCWHVPAARVVHLVGQSTGVYRPTAVRKRQPLYWFASRRRYFLRNLGPVRAHLADAAWALGFATFRVRQFLQRKVDDTPHRLLWDFCRYNFLGRSKL